MSGAFVVRIIASADGSQAFGPLPVYLKTFDAEAHDGIGNVEITRSLDEAMLFESYDAAFALWLTQSRTKPRRPDGEANRPMTAFTVMIEPKDATP